MVAGKDYELLVKEVYEILNSIDGLEDIDVQHDIELQGNARSHQVDVYWEFKKAGIPFRVVVECKDYKNPVEANKIESFHSVLMDLNNPKGIFVSRNGYQKGAIDYASHYGIQLMVIHGPEDENWDGRIKTVQIDIILKMIENVRMQVDVDDVWAKENNIGPETPLFEGYTDEDVYVYQQSEDGSVVRGNVKRMVEHFPRDKEGKDIHKRIDYDNAFLECGEARYKIKALVFTYDIVHYHEVNTIDAAQMIKAFIKNVIEGEVKILDYRGRVRLQEKE